METIPHQTAPNSPPPFIFAPPQDKDESNFDFWGILSRRKWLVFLGIITGMALGALYHAQADTIYKSEAAVKICLLYTSPSPRDRKKSRMPSSA